ncbi:ABC transporter ATP-binding protein [Burkholderia ubonensis]|uniref:ABC transporter ATP-binding protein n=1 Tax=Burkholderia ubonensis TaxID=101571 RepID=A0A103R7D6_9BURK|nr:ABC transporter ATP-binding protein [Burkholderia ubonensis]AOJ65013.1 ABC transporter ATP-binding protein [Burkholderia ubonensis]KVG62567.1 ABC transporter ATP-binding protein [Burkholderia ubonensis]
MRAAADSDALIQLENVGRTYRMEDQLVVALRDVSLNIRRGERCALVGASGSGKTTLLNILGLLDRPSSGRFLLGGTDILQAGRDDLSRIRNREIGFVFQSFNLLPRLTALDNVALPLSYRGFARGAAREAAMERLAQVGLADRAGHRPADLSGGQRQRVAIARALIGSPSIILADEPTGNLDAATAGDIMALLLSLNEEHGVTLVMVTHDATLAGRFRRRIEVRSGAIRDMTSAIAHEDA